MGEITRSRIGSLSHLFPTGPLDRPEAIAALERELSESIARGEMQLVVDLSEVSVVNSAALEALAEAHETLSRIGGRLRLAHPNQVIGEVLDLTGLSGELEVLSASTGSDAPEPGGERLVGARIGEILVARGHVEEAQVEAALEIQANTGRRMAEVMVEEGWLSEADLLSALSEQLALPLVRLRAGLYDAAAARLLEVAVAKRLGVLPLFRVRENLFIATPNPQSIPTADAVEDLTGLRVKPVLATATDVEKATDDAYGEVDDLAQYVGDLEGDIELVESHEPEDEDLIDQMAEGNPVINLINGIIQRAIKDRASDIHIEPARSKCRIRFRVDGVLYPVMSPGIEIHPALVSRLKVMAKLDIAERRLPQDGRIQVVTGGRSVDLRFSSLPGIYGEKIVLRVLDKNESILEISRLGFSNTNEEGLVALLARSYGLILVTGPTGSGKTTTLYAGVNHIASDEKNIVTIEDPVEYQIDAISQNQVRENIGLSFAKILKHVLRQDPDVIMVGEIREQETAEIAVQAALTGHLVISTLHTNDSLGAITRMLEMGVEPFLLSSALIGVVAQRLVRRVCPKCTTSYAAPAGALDAYGVDHEGQLTLYRGRGCSHCYDSGYRGRRGIHEVLIADDALQRLILENPTRTELDAYRDEHQVTTLQRDGIQRAIEGETTVEEVLRVVNT
ncbi:MAG: ATPase, T2SS/T4P/T4SS family [Myxococcota bacterium]